MVLHGGPGAPGSAKGLAEALAPLCGVLEPMQTRNSIDGQVEELVRVIRAEAELPVVLVGWSWGAMLGYITAARHPELVRKLVLVGSGVFEDHFAEVIMPLRLRRLEPGEQAEAQSLMRDLADRSIEDKSVVLQRFGRLMDKADSYDPIKKMENNVHCDFDIHVNVWKDAQRLRYSGELLDMGRDIRCPVVALHGNHDPHPAEGVRAPLSRVIHDFRFILLDKCGHSPWNEKMARESFLKHLRAELESEI
ncbi:alpha/beta fold hydrolase [Salidesulfovibrio onnuriiensis]|uniref:alpha/beta fold hydrolase n=1 Tax=Salidesulfovibrio onnuriiensis TaxID=2583823 RepID=UPI00202AD548|nr:alpha/beta hydrolase [Salidesulfovibrio onnuriiensis]